MANPSHPLSTRAQKGDPEEQFSKQSYKQPSVQDQTEDHSEPGDVGHPSQVPVLYDLKAVKDCAADVAEHLGDEDVKLIDDMFQVQQLTIQKLFDLKISPPLSIGSTSPAATSEATDQELKTAAELSSDAATVIKNELDDFKVTIVQSFADMKQSWAEHKRGVGSHFRALEATPPTSPSPGASPRDVNLLTSELQPNPYSTLPPQSVANTELDPDRLVTFIELWNHNFDYTGELYDILDDKVRLMLNLCKTLGIQASQFHAIFPSILRGRAEIYYVYNVHHNDTFATAYKKVKNRFDDAANHNIYYTDWTTTTFESSRKKYRAEHPGPEDLQKVLQSMLDKLQLCQRALGPAYAADIHLRDNVLRACRGVPAFHHACFNALSNPLQRPEELFSTLRRSLQVYLDCRPSRRQPVERRVGKSTF